MTGPDDLTPGERRVLRAVARSGSQKEAAVELGIKTQTVKNILYNIYRRFEVGNILSLYREIGWLKIPPTEGP